MVEPMNVAPLKVVYIAGPFRAETNWQIEQNIREAQTLALAVWRLGGVVLCPHTNTGLCFEGAAPDEIFLAGGVVLVSRSDALLLHPRWRDSSGTRAEVEDALRLKLPCFQARSVTDVPDLVAGSRDLSTGMPLLHWLKAP